MIVTTKYEIGQLVYWVDHPQAFNKSLFQSGYEHIENVSVKLIKKTGEVQISYKMESGHHLKEENVHDNLDDYMRRIKEILTKSVKQPF